MSVAKNKKLRYNRGERIGIFAEVSASITQKVRPGSLSVTQTLQLRKLMLRVADLGEP